MLVIRKRGQFNMRVFSVNQSESRPSFGKIVIERDGFIEIQKLAKASLDTLKVNKPDKFSSAMEIPANNYQLFTLNARKFFENISDLERNSENPQIPKAIRKFYDFFSKKHKEINAVITAKVENDKILAKITVKDENEHTFDEFSIMDEDFNFNSACKTAVKDVKALRKQYFAKKAFYNNWDEQTFEIRSAAVADLEEFFNKTNHTVS